jgi:hypothetical protein
VTLKAFLFLLVVTIVAVTGAALIAEALLPPGFERGILIAVLSGLVVFPAARWAEYRGWIKGSWSPGGDQRRERDARRAQEAAGSQPAEGPPRGQELPAGDATDSTEDPQHAPAGQAPSVLPAGDFKSPGDPR